METLTKENFFNALQEKCPLIMEKFCEWIDEYKKRVEWDRLFRDRNNRDKDDRPITRTPKFHEIPIAMQIGIFLQFTFEQETTNHFLQDQDIRNMEQFVAQMRDWFALEQAVAKDDMSALQDHLNDLDHD